MTIIYFLMPVQDESAAKWNANRSPKGRFCATGCEMCQLPRVIFVIFTRRSNGKAGSRWEPLLGKRTLGALYLRSPGCGSRLPPATRAHQLVHHYYLKAGPHLVALSQSAGAMDASGVTLGTRFALPRIRPTGITITWTMRATIALVQIADNGDHYRRHREIFIRMVNRYS